MSEPEASEMEEPAEDLFDPTSRRARIYMWAATLFTVALAGVTALVALEQVRFGFLTTRTAFVALGLSVAVLAITELWTLLSMSGTLEAVRRHDAKVERIRAAREQHAREQGDVVQRLQTLLEQDLVHRLEDRIGRVESRIDHLRDDIPPAPRLQRPEKEATRVKAGRAQRDLDEPG